jgi:hypothetical protein
VLQTALDAPYRHVSISKKACVMLPWVHYVAASVGFSSWAYLAVRYWRRYRTTRDSHDLGVVVMLAFFCFLTLTPIWLFHQRLEPAVVLTLQECLGFFVMAAVYLLLKPPPETPAP